MTAGQTGQTDKVERDASLASRLLKPRVGAMLVRNTVVSTGVFAIGLGILWLLVEQAGMDTVLATGCSFIAANSLHYVLGRTWIFRGTDRAVGTGWLLFILTGIFGLSLTMALMAVLLEYTAINYLIARILVSIIAGLMMFVFNAVVNFRRV